MSDVELDYHYLTNKALKGVLRDVLSLTQELGTAPGEHHFYIEFQTTADGVTIPDHLLQSYPERMTIVLQHQFKELVVADERFEVTLWFKGAPAHLIIPYDAVLSFADPSVQFGLRFDLPEGGEGDDTEGGGEAAEQAAGAAPDDARSSDETDDEAEGTADVVSLDAFRKK